ncbi:MAG: FG-GAP repeat protein [Planctomycetota bacterium]
MTFMHSKPAITALVGIVLAGTSTSQSVIGCTPPSAVNPQDFVCLDDYATNNDLLFRSIGEVNFYQGTNSQFLPFIPNAFADPYTGAYDNEPFRVPYGDRLGYAGSGLFDVDGDGYNDWSVTWYDAQPVRAIDGTHRVPADAYVLPVIAALENHPSFVETPAELASKTTWNKVGMLRVFSGRDNSQIGQEIWGHNSHCLFPHEIAPLRDIDGDGRDELALSANSTDQGRGSVNVMSFTNRYNERDTSGALLDTEERWVCIMRIVGKSGPSEFAYELEDTQSDFNNDGQHDIVAASRFWRARGWGSRFQNDIDITTGGGWIFLTPPQQVFLDMQNSLHWPKDPERNNVKRPIELVAEDDYNLCVMQLDDTAPDAGTPLDRFDDPNDPSDDAEAAADTLESVGRIGDIADAGDIDGDGHADFAVTAHYRYDDGSGPVTTGAIYFLLSADGFGPTQYTLHNKASRITGVAYDPATNEDELVLDPQFQGIAIDPYTDAEVVFHGDDQRAYKNNQRSYFGVTLAGNDPADMALITYSSSGNFGEVDILLNEGTTPRFASTGSIGSLVPPNYADRPLALFYDDPLIAPDHSFNGPALGLGHISGVELAGNFDGLGENDCELGVTTNKGYRLTTTNPNFSIISTANIVEIPATGSPSILQAIQHETPQYNSDVTPVIGSSYADNGMMARGLKAQAAWDQDGDGKDDLLLRTAATAGAIRQAPDPFGSNTPVTLFDEANPLYSGYRPYFVDDQQHGAGSAHIMLSPADEPVLISGESRAAFSLAHPSPHKVFVISLKLDQISSHIDPADSQQIGETFTRQFDHLQFFVELVDCPTCTTVLASTTATAVPVAAAPSQRAPKSLSFTLPQVGTATDMLNRHLRIWTRWKDGTTGLPWSTSVPELVDPVFDP